MNKISSIGISAAIITGLVILAATTNSVLALNAGIPGNRSMASQPMNQQTMAQLFSGKNVTIGKMTLGMRPGVMVMPLMCMTFSGNFSGFPMFGNMIARNMNQSSMMMGPGAQGKQSMSGVGAMMNQRGMIPSVCFSMSDAMLFRSMMAQGGSMNGMMGGNMTRGSAVMGGGR
ncbi:MAG: hypothetical protein JO327_02340 [Nitrososphaeraceae archaeon]|nr:hypothetical protein [Nitrososphaeraceae archaeon]